MIFEQYYYPAIIVYPFGDWGENRTPLATYSLPLATLRVKTLQDDMPMPFLGEPIKVVMIGEDYDTIAYVDKFTDACKFMDYLYGQMDKEKPEYF